MLSKNITVKASAHRDEYRRALFASVFQRVFCVYTQAIFADDEPSEHANSFPDIRWRLMSNRNTPVHKVALRSASDTRLSLRRREQVFTRLSKSYKENMDISSTRSSSNEEIIVLLNEERRRRRQCRRYLAYIFFVITYVCSARLFCVWAPPSCVLL